MNSLVCECMEYVDPNNICHMCGYPICETEDCYATPGCDHVSATEEALPMSLRKKLHPAYDAGVIEYHTASIQCYVCEQNYCEECYNEYAVRYNGYLFTPQMAFKYSRNILDAAMGIYLVNKRRSYHEKLPKSILMYVVSFL